MPTFETFITFMVALCLLELIPGPDMMLIIARGVGQGRRAAIFTVVGMVFFAGIIQVSMLVLGLATLVHAYPLSLDILRWAGAAYLIYLGFNMLRSSAATGAKSKSSVQLTDWQAIRGGAINSLTNPKSLLFMFAFLPQFVDPAVGPVWLQLLILGSLQKLIGIFSQGFIALASGSMGKWLSRNPALIIWQERFTGLVMLSLALRLLITGNPTKS